jgi:hypothetical protein
MPSLVAMNTSCGELGLRIALCDLIERLKRCEQKCSYLEECRHELIREVMRLKIQNQSLIANSANTSNAYPITDTNHLVLSPIHGFNTNNNNNVMIGSVNGHEVVANKDMNKSRAYDLIGSDCDNQDENWQQITVRLLRDMRRDMAANGHQLGGHDIIDKIVANDMQSNTNLHNDTIITINDSLTQMNDNLIESKTYSTIGRQKVMTNDRNLSPFDELSATKSPYLIGISDNKVDNNNELLSDLSEPESGCQEGKQSLKMVANSSPVLASNDPDSDGVKAFCSAMSYVKEDLNEVLVALTTQNEKLNRLKAKKLRDFFNRQINFDQNIQQTSPPSKRQQSTHQNH